MVGRVLPASIRYKVGGSIFLSSATPSHQLYLRFGVRQASIALPTSSAKQQRYTNDQSPCTIPSQRRKPVTIESRVTSQLLETDLDDHNIHPKTTSCQSSTSSYSNSSRAQPTLKSKMYGTHTLCSTNISLRRVDSDLTNAQVCKRMTGLAEKCMHPTSNKPYFKSHGGGRDNSPEGQQVVVLVPSNIRLHMRLTHLTRVASRMDSSVSLRTRRTGSTSKLHH